MYTVLIVHGTALKSVVVRAKSQADAEGKVQRAIPLLKPRLIAPGPLTVVRRA